MTPDTLATTRLSSQVGQPIGVAVTVAPPMAAIDTRLWLCHDPPPSKMVYTRPPASKEEAP